MYSSNSQCDLSPFMKQRWTCFWKQFIL